MDVGCLDIFYIKAKDRLFMVYHVIIPHSNNFCFLNTKGYMYCQATGTGTGDGDGTGDRTGDGTSQSEFWICLTN